MRVLIRFAGMKINVFLVLLGTTLLLNACIQNTDSQAQKAFDLHFQTEFTDSVEKLQQLFATALQFPNFSGTPGHMQHAALRMYSYDAHEAGKMNRTLYETYPDSPFAADALFNAAFMLEPFEHLVAIDLYKRFINFFPKDDRVEDVKMNLRFVGKSPEYIMEQFRKEGKVKEEDEERDIVP
jgi:lipopolysaccharide biosynthesis protein